MRLEELSRVHDALNWARAYCEQRDRANAAIHLSAVEFRPLTLLLREAEALVAHEIAHYGEEPLPLEGGFNAQPG